MLTQIDNMQKNKINLQDVRLEDSWKALLAEEFSKPYMLELKKFLKTERAKKKEIYPPGPQIFSALNTTPFDNVKVVILGQDPYHGPGQAHGLCFSVQKDIRKPPSLKNIYKEIERDLCVKMPDSGDLTAWAQQGVLLLNSVLTVEATLAGSHQGKGWETFTDKIISLINEHKKNIVFLLWGTYAIKKASFIDEKKHHVLQSVHPSPLSAHRGFLGNCHFSKTNEYLKKHKIATIQWNKI